MGRQHGPSVEGLIDDVVELSQAAGIIDAVEDNEIQQGFSVSDIGLIEDITNSLVDSSMGRW